MKKFSLRGKKIKKFSLRVKKIKYIFPAGQK
jgi:hypothetical protein